MLLDYPKYTCQQCFELYRETDRQALPECFTTGCPVGVDIATDDELEAKCHKFIRAKALYRATEDARVQQMTFEELGLYDNPELHLELEGIYSEWINRQQAKQLAKKHIDS